MTKSNIEDLPETFSLIKERLFKQYPQSVQNLIIEQESREYEALNFELKGFKILYRKAKITPTKAGQFVTLWKRTENGPIAPYHLNEHFDFVIIATRKNDSHGLFLFPKSILVKQGIISTPAKEGKRGFRVYPPWDITTNKQAQKTQEWQLQHFVDFGNQIEQEGLKMLLS
ncbi:MepB family protein [Flexithrix dorotheae]|uniref:MepB family protein n=1 Tax=Flexithrix dorotheae TaxID=70993 RepID=UPI00038290EB|nr:MepB family protein [Flexithrix dorotheae]